jgi:hypothetical protein
MRLCRRFLSAVGISAVMVLGLMIAPAQATTWHDACGNPSGLEPDNCLQWTGGYPGGVIRAWAPSRYYYAIRLDTCPGTYDHICSMGVWRTVETKVLNKQAGVTASFQTTRTGWFRLCAKVLSGASWGCTGVTGDYTIVWPLYLGD